MMRNACAPAAVNHAGQRRAPSEWAINPTLTAFHFNGHAAHDGHHTINYEMREMTRNRIGCRLPEFRVVSRIS